MAHSTVPVVGDLKHGGIPGEPIQFRETAVSLTNRGFHSVLFGPTYHTGSWLVQSDHVEIERGKISLRTWEHGA